MKQNFLAWTEVACIPYNSITELVSSYISAEMSPDFPGAGQILPAAKGC
jgi:hypothetical protein